MGKVASPKIVSEVKRRIESLDVDFINGSRVLSQLIEDSPYSIFPQILSTERPDRTSALIMAGKVAIIADGAPTAEVVPINLIQDQKPKINISFSNGKPVIHEKIILEGELYAIQSNVNYTDLKLKHVLEKAFEKNLENEIYRAIDKCKSLKCDVFGFGLHAVKYFSTIQKWEDYNWNKQFQYADVTVEIKFNIRRTGVMINTSPIISSDGKNK